MPMTSIETVATVGFAILARNTPQVIAGKAVNRLAVQSSPCHNKAAPVICILKALLDILPLSIARAFEAALQGFHISST